MSRQAYAQYKPSGVSWLGDIPEHWEIRRLKYSADLINTKIDGAAADLPYTGLEHIESWTGKRISPNGDITSEGQANLYGHGDVLFGKLRPYLAKAHATEIDGICTGELLVLRPKAVKQMFLLNYVLNPDFVTIVDSSTYGAKMPRANWEFIGNLPALIPPMDEQQAIVAFLDRETARIDALIEKKQRQIELLQEKRSALISHAVTKGLNPNAKMKDSGIEWLGSIPVHWKVCLFKRVAKTSYGVGGEIDRTIIDGTPILSLPNVDIDGRLLLNDVPLKPLTDNEKRDLLLKKGDLLFNWRNGSPQHLGKTAFFDLDGEYSHVSFLLRLRFDPTNNNSRYFQELLSGFRITGFFSSSKAGVNNTFNQSELDNLWVVVPPKDEQSAIAFFLNRETAKIDALIGKVEKSVNLLHEHRTALISAAVRGKINVRKEEVP